MATKNGNTESEETRGVPSLEEPRGRRIPLNSKRLTVVHLRQLGKSLGLPVRRSGEEIRQLIERKMSEREDPCVQVHVEEEPQLRTVLWLVDSNGPFLQTQPTYQKWSEGTREVHLQDSDELELEVKSLRVQVRTLEERLSEMTSRVDLAGLESEVARLREELESEREKRRQNWKLSCEQVAEMDAQLVQKENEIAELREQLAGASLTAPPTGAGIESSTSVQAPVSDSHSPALNPVSPARSAAPVVAIEPSGPAVTDTRTTPRRGKAPPVIPFNGESIRKYGSIFYVGIGQVINGCLYLRYGSRFEKTTAK